MTDLFLDDRLPANKPPTPSLGKIIATYDYLNEDKQLLFQVVRYDPKDFRQRHKNGNGEWVWNLDGVRRVPYHLDRLVQMGLDPIWLVEGEKDADNLWLWGRPATTSPCGASAWKSDYAEYLRGHKVIIIPDQDTPGLQYARDAANSLDGTASELKVIMLPKPFKDISDWIEAGNDTALLDDMEQDISVLFEGDKPLYRKVDESIVWDKRIGNLPLTFKAEKISDEHSGIHARISMAANRASLAWTYLNIERAEDRTRIANSAHAQLKTEATYSKDDLRRDLDSFCAGLWDFYLSRFIPVELSGDDNPAPLSFYLKPYIVESGGTIIFAPPGRGKSYTGLLWGISIDAGCQQFWAVKQQRTLFINLERSADSLRRRIGMVNKLLGLPASRPLLTLNARGHSLMDVIAGCRKAVKKHNIGLVILDSISRAGLGDLTENQSGNRVIDALSSLCPTWLALGHTPRDSEEHMYGSVMQDAGADICVQLSSQVKDDGTLGVGWNITKQNDIGYHPMKIYAMEFSEQGLTGLRPAKAFEFPDVEGKSPTDMLTTILDWVVDQDTGDANATEVERALGYSRPRISKLFSQSGRFTQTRRVGHSIYYGVKE